MLYSVIYDADTSQLNNGIVFCADTGEVYPTIQEWLDNIPAGRHVFYRLDIFYPILEDFFIQNGYTSRMNKGDNFTFAQKRYLKSKEYIANIVADDIGNRRIFKMFLNQNTELYEFSPFITDNWIDITQISSYLCDKEIIEIADSITKMDPVPRSPAGILKAEVNKYFSYNGYSTSIFRYAGRNQKAIECLLLAAKNCVQNQPVAIQKTYKKGYFKKLYDYDITSMYPYCLYQLANCFPYIEATYECVMDEQVLSTDERLGVEFGFSLGKNGLYTVKFPGEKVKKGDFIVPTIKGYKTKITNLVNYLFNEKQAAKKKGANYYKLYKRKINSFIGCFAEKARASQYTNLWQNGTVKMYKPNFVSYSRYDVFAIITALARRYISKWVSYANKMPHNKVITVNTDGFTTIKPLPKNVLEDDLGGLRLDKVLTNVWVKSYVQMIADGYVCIAGLPKILFDPEITTYNFPVPQRNPKNRYYQIENRTYSVGWNAMLEA